MIDARRWVLVEAWLALGLRIEWQPGYENVPSDELQDDSEHRFHYAGHGTWRIEQRGARYQVRTDPPTLSPEAMAHELAHYLTATEEERGQRNFGLKQALRSDQEDRALEAEKVLQAVVEACGRIASLALRAGR